MFMKLRRGDLLILVQTASHGRAVAVGEVAYPAVSEEVNREMLYDRVPDRLRRALDAYLDRGASFDYVQFARVYDVRDCNKTYEELLAQCGFGMKPNTNLGMGLLDTVESSASSIDRLRCFLVAHAKCVALPATDGVDAW